MNNPKHVYVYDKIPLNISTAGLSKQEIEMLSFFSTKTLENINNFTEDSYIPFASDFAQRLFTSRYSKSLNTLVSMGHIEPKVLGYDKNGYPYFYDKTNNVCISYTLSPESIYNLQQKQYSKQLLKLPYLYSPINLPEDFYAISKSDSPLVQKIEDAYRGIKISEDWQTLFNPENPDADFNNYAAAKHYAKQIQTGEIKVSMGESGRIFHPLICMQREMRAFVSKDGGKLIAVDGKAFHPHLLATFLPDSNRRHEYLDFLAKADIYSLFMPEYYEDYDEARDEVKRIFQIFLGDETPRGKAIEISSWYDANFPEIIREKNRIQEAGGTVQMKLQKIESDIFIKNIFDNADFWCLPMHDGIAVKPEDTERGVDFCSRHIQQYLGFNIRVEFKPL